MIPGKQYRPEDFIRAAWRRRWMILVPVVLAAAATAIWSLGQPDEYRSETTLLIVPPSGAGNLVSEKGVVPIEDRLYTIRQQVVSRDRLMELIDSADLYPELRRTRPTADVADRMRKDVDIQIVKGNPRRIDGNFFKIGFVSTNPQTAAMVTNRLADLLVRENADDRKNAARAATSFIEGQLTEARNKLEAQEAKVEAYRQRFSSEQPSMLQSNLEAIRRTETQLQNLEAALSAERGQHVALESMIAAAETPMPPGAGPEPRRRPAEVSGASVGVQLDAARNELKTLELQLTPEHPDVVRAQRRIHELEDRARAEGVPQSADGDLLSAAEIARRQRVQELQGQLKSLDQQIADKEQNLPRLKQAIAMYQGRVDATPTHESELTSLTRDQATLQAVYQKLLSDRENSGIATSLEADQTERFKVIEPAQVPTKPFRPNRPEWVFLGGLFGLGLGIGLVALFEYRDSSLRTDHDVLAALGLPVLAMIPVMHTSAEANGRRNLRAAISALVVTLMGTVVALVWKFTS
jgi:polysaccharide chain length determinant protein (PEP-CTERM system associated)